MFDHLLLKTAVQRYVVGYVLVPVFLQQVDVASPVSKLKACLRGLKGASRGAKCSGFLFGLFVLQFLFSWVGVLCALVPGTLVF